MGKVYVIGDIHGGYKSLIQCLERSNFDKENDTLISLGDIVDGWPDSFECVEELLTIKKLIAIKGNHDDWFNDFINYGIHPVGWAHGGGSTRESYIQNCNMLIPKSHKDFFNNQHLYYIDHKNRMFVHGGWNRDYFVSDIKAVQPYEFYWDRNLWSKAMSCKGDQKLKTMDDFSMIFLGHTATVNWFRECKNLNLERITTPMFSGGVCNVDTGGGFHGKLTIMNVETKEYFQSDLVYELYKGIPGRI